MKNRMMISLEELRFFIITLCIIVLSILSVILFRNAIIVEIVMLVGLILFVYKRDISTLRYFIVCTIFQNFLLIIMAPYISSFETTLIIILKELLVYGCAIIYFIEDRIIKMEVKDLLFIIFTLISIFQLMRGGTVSLGITALRQIIIVFTCFYFGCSLRIKDIEKSYSTILFYSIIVSIAGFVFFFMSDQDWLNIGYAEFWKNKTKANMSYSFVNFYTYDLGIRLKRIVSLFVDPLACSHFIGIAFLVVFFTKKKNNYVAKIILTLALIMGITKSSVVLILSAVIILNYTKIKSKILRKIFIMACLSIGVAGLFVLSGELSNLANPTSIANHFFAFIYGLRNANLLGNGLGTTGYNALIMGLDNYDSGYNESFFALTVAQVGILGVIALYSFWIICIKNNYLAYRQTQNKYVMVTLILSIDLFIESLFSASSVSMLGTGLYCVLSGITYNVYKQEEMVNANRNNNISCCS